PYRSAKTRKGRVGFYGDAAPTLDMKRKRRVVVNGMSGSDVDVESGTSAAEATHEIEVLEALSIRDDRLGHGSSAMGATWSEARRYMRPPGNHPGPLSITH